MIKEKKELKNYLLIWLIAFSLFARFSLIYFFKDTYVDLDLYSTSVNEWNILLENLVNYKSYSFYNFDNQLIPSVYMPPIYPFFLYSVKVITSFENTNFLYVIIFIQIILSTYSVYLFYQINQNFFSNKLSLVNSFIYSFLPLNIYACGQISSINLQIIFSLLFIKFLLKLIKKEELKNIIYLSIVSGLLVLTRGEFILIFLITIFFLAFSKKIKISNLLKIILIVSLIISPYMVRNYLHFNQIFIVKSLGYNLWKGNNELSAVQGYENYANVKFVKLDQQLNKVEKNKYYEINRDNVFLNEAKNNLKIDPLRYISLFVQKFFSFYFIDFNSTYLNYFNAFNIIPIALISILSFPGLFLFVGKKNILNNYLIFYLFLNLAIFSVFFILPRYKLIILPIQIMLATYAIAYLLKKISNNKNNIDTN